MLSSARCNRSISSKLDTPITPQSHQRFYHRERSASNCRQNPIRRAFFESVADAVFRQNVDWTGGIRLNLAAQLADVDARIVNIVGIFASTIRIFMPSQRL